MADPAPSKVKVVVRIRPFVAKEVHKRCVVVSQTEKAAIELRRSTHAPVLSYGFVASPQHLRLHSFLTGYRARFDGAYDSDSHQEELFKNDIEPMIDSVFKGIHTTIFAYGITGAGKNSNFFQFNQNGLLSPLHDQAKPSPCRGPTNSPASSPAWHARWWHWLLNAPAGQRDPRPAASAPSRSPTSKSTTRRCSICCDPRPKTFPFVRTPTRTS
jgi:hypothetical protein